MKRRNFLALGGASLLCAPVAGFASTITSATEAIISQLRAQGFSRIKLSRTFLGRTRLVALSKTLRREIIVNPRTGEILRDYWENLQTGQEITGQIVDPNGQSGPPASHGDGSSGSGDGSSGGGDGSSGGGDGSSGGGDGSSGGGGDHSGEGENGH